MDDMKRLRIDEAIAWARKQGIKVVMQDLAVKMFPDASSRKSAVVCLDNARRGKTVNFNRLQIIAVAEYLSIDPRQLLEWEEN
jgi:hypothetical protein